MINQRPRPIRRSVPASARTLVPALLALGVAPPAVLEVFRDHNAWTLRALFPLFTHGPVEWAAVLGGG